MGTREENDEGRTSRSDKPSHIASRTPRRAAPPRTDEEAEGAASVDETLPENEDSSSGEPVRD
ncbi:hypothetical protein ACSBPH_04970 [Microbacterium sp. F51-2R]|uniref:hypothetical protein n=1 Tax=Microbacterium sp. F51-2R TaxID=3445777 RepID=UPI003FA0292D